MTSALKRLQESAFNRFRGISTHAQPVETEEGGWKTMLETSGNKKMFNAISITKGAALVGLIATIIIGGPVTGSLVMLAGSIYGISAALQSVGRTGSEGLARNAKTRNFNEDLYKTPQLLKNFGRYLLPF